MANAAFTVKRIVSTEVVHAYADKANFPVMLMDGAPALAPFGEIVSSRHTVS